MRRNPSPRSRDNHISSIKACLCVKEKNGSEAQAVYSFHYKHITAKNVEYVVCVADQQGPK